MGRGKTSAPCSAHSPSLTDDSFLAPSQLKEPLGITNKHVGYIYLVDPDCKIRWAGNAYATEEERQGLRKAVAVLMARVREGKEPSTATVQSSDVTP